MFLSFIIISLLLSRYNPVPYSERFQKVVEKFPHYKLKIDIPNFPEKSAATKIGSRSLVNTLFVGAPEDDSIPNYAVEWGSEFTFEELSLLIENFKMNIP